MDRDPFEWWYPLATIARRTDKSPLTIRRAMLSGKFGGRPGEPGFSGRFICGQWHFPWSAVAVFLGVPPGERASAAVAFRARTEGELRRKVAALSIVQSVGQEVSNG
jgi:hypothetical protein